MARHGGGGGGNGPEINVGAPHVGQFSAIVLVAFAVGLFLMPFRYVGACLRILVIAAIFIVPYAWIISSLGESNLFDHPLLCLPLVIAGLWVGDAMREKDEARKAQKLAQRQKGTRT